MSSSLSRFDPAVAGWFRERFEAPTEPQANGWPVIARGDDVLITAPTGSGKTLAAFLFAVDRLIREARQGPLPDETRVVYVSPLKALSADIRRNLEVPLTEIAARARGDGGSFSEVRAELRTGDTPAAARARMTRKPPHILVTTPESLYLLLTAGRGRELLRTADTVIVDEIHALARDKRGSHLALSLERLDRLAGRPLQRIGLSATVRPLSEVARFLSPRTPGGPTVVPVGHRREMDLAVEIPDSELGAVATHEIMEDIRDRIAALIEAHDTTLVFVNTRRMAERLTHVLSERLPEDAVLAHHGSLAREVRLEAERRLQEGEVRAIVATASLELGIDIGSVDLACQLGSPRSIAVALQRVGRSGHWLGAIPRGRFFPTTRDELVECAALIAAVQAGDLDRIHIPEAPLDIVAQQLVAETGATPEERHDLDALFSFVRGAHPYRNLDRSAFDAVVRVLSDGVATARGRRGAFLHLDAVSGTVRARRNARLAAIQNGGAIPETAQYQVVAEPDDRVVGQLDEDFAIESYAGDVFLLGTTSWRIRRIAQGQVRVEDAEGAAPTIPFWRGEAPGRTAELSARVAELRDRVDQGAAEARNGLQRDCRLDGAGTDQLLRYLAAGKAALGAMPSQRTVVAERFFDDSGGMQLVIHAPFGSRINRAWGLALRKRFCRSFNLELQAAATDDGIVISLTDLHSFPLESVFSFLTPENLEHVLTQAVLGVPLFAARWRWAASRALAVPRRRHGQRVPPPIQRMLTDDLLAAVFPDQAACAENLAGEVRIPEHPLVDEAIRDCLREALDVDGLRVLLEDIGAGKVRTVAVDTPEASPFAAEILNANPFAFLDPAPLEERRSRAVRMRRSLPPELDTEAVLDPEAIAQAAAEAAPLVRDADELHDALLTVGVVRETPEWEVWFEELAGAHRAAVFAAGDARFWVAADRLGLARAVWPDACLPAAIPAPSAGDAPETRAHAVAAILRGVMDCSGPATAGALAARLALPEDRIEAALALLEAEGLVLQGRFRSSAAGDGPSEWCHRRVLARIHRLTLARLRRESAPVSAAAFLEFLAGWQHLTAETRLHGPRGVREVIAQLQGLEAPAAAWESQILPLRVTGYRRDWLDENCLSGEVVWGRTSVPEPSGNGDPAARRPARPTRAAPIGLLLRSDVGRWLRPRVGDPEGLSSAAGKVLGLLERGGAQFFAELQARSGLLPAALEDALWELAACGRVTADGFDNLRALMDPRRRSAYGRYRRRKARYSAGRWALLAAPAGDGEGPEDHEGVARQLLRRWGVVFREILKRERTPSRWRDLQLVLRRLEMRGEVVGGQFVSTFPGEQFALPEAVAPLRRAGRNGAGPGVRVTIGAADPLNLSGILVPGSRIPVTSSENLILGEGGLRPAGQSPVRPELETPDAGREAGRAGAPT
ncbi:MAG: DEAD/DEAH box helicase [Acidobacteria bacterium]|nr:DEAD/DEAH box helicase [Acidobacteriota bacterium]MYK80012.1 DEAD/DEAH box helicase [Acidobacteriota bacterium]